MAITKEMYGQILGATTLGRARKNQSDIIMDATFDGDIQYQTAYFFDYYHTTADNRLKLERFDPNEDTNPIPVEIKFIAHSSKTYEKDEVTMHIQFRPGHECAVDYYDEMFSKRYDARYPVGLYCWIKGEDDIYRRWLVVSTADRDENQFSTWEVLRCDNVFRWIKNGKYYEFPGVSRSQNSYNSGLWRDYRFQQPEDQVKFALPLNRDTEYLYYNTRLIIDANVLTEPRAWLVSKINRMNSKGIVIYTLTQDLFNEHTDKADYDENGNVIAWWADWNSSLIVPEEGIQDVASLLPSIISKITASGNSKQIRIGGQKTFTLSFYEDDEAVEHDPGEWSFFIEDKDISDILSISYPAENKVKIKFNGDDNYIGKIITINNTTSDEIIASIDVEIIAL